MNQQIKQIALRLRGLREAIELTAQQVAERIEVAPEQVTNYETGEVDIPMSYLCKVAQVFGVDTSTLVSGTEPHAQSFYLTRKGKGPSVERSKAYKYQHLASGFIGANSTPFEVSVEPNDKPVQLNHHTGQEFNLVLEGTLELHIAGNKLILELGDSIYFDATKPHGMKAVNQTVRFLAMIV